MMESSAVVRHCVAWDSLAKRLAQQKHHRP